MALWVFLSGTFHLIGACAATALAVWIVGHRQRLGEMALPLIVALSFSASWAICAATFGAGSAGTALAESLRNLAWLYLVWRQFQADGRNDLVKPVRPMVIVLAVVEIIQASSLIVLHHLIHAAYSREWVFMASVVLRLFLTIGGLVLVHNLYSGATAKARLALRWPTLAMAVLWFYDLNLYTVAYLGVIWPTELAALRGLVLAVTVALLTPMTARRPDELKLLPSRELTFQFASLAGIGAYFGGMVVLARSLELVGGNIGRLLQFSFLIAASTIALLALPSKRVRGWMKVVLVKHLFRHRYDYRSEWLRLAQTIGRTSETALPLEERAIQAMAQVLECPAGLLLVPGDHGDLQLSGRWNWPSADVPASAMGVQAVRFFERSGHIVELDAVRNDSSLIGEDAVIPLWLLDEPKAWGIVPLIQYERLIGLVVLARPAEFRKLDWEDFDLLRVIGQQLATTLAEHASHDALAEAARFDEFHRRIAFVMHDIKNLASQLGLLARNAEMHAEKAEFRADMLVTLRNSADKLNALIARLSRYRAGGAEALAKFDVGEVVRTVAGQFEGLGKVTVTECRGAVANGNKEALEQALTHLVQNAVDASADKTPVFLSQTSDGMHAIIEVVDSGPGMSPDFVRTRLFKPFISSKQGGFGIGAFEARELIRAMKGRLDVESREGLGTRFIVRLPLSSTAELISNFEQNSKKVA